MSTELSDSDNDLGILVYDQNMFNLLIILRRLKLHKPYVIRLEVLGIVK